MNELQIKTAARATMLFNQAADAWVYGNNSGKSDTLERMERHCEQLRADAEMMLAGYGIVCDYPGLYPSFTTVDGQSHHDTARAMSQAIYLREQAAQRQDALRNCAAAFHDSHTGPSKHDANYYREYFKLAVPDSWPEIRNAAHAALAELLAVKS